MNILQVVPVFSPAWGGTSTAAFQLSKTLSERGNDVTLATTDFRLDEEYRHAITERGVEVVPFHCAANINSFLFSPSMKRWLNARIADFDVIHLHDFRSYQNYLVHSLSNRHQIPYVLQPDNSLPRMNTRKKLQWLYDIFCGFSILKDLGAFVAISEEEVRSAKSFGISERSIHLIYLGIDDNVYFGNPPTYGEFREKHRIRGRMILYLGRIHKSKGIDTVVRAFSKIVERQEDAVLVIAGSDDGYQTELEKLISELGINNKVLITGYVDQLDKVRAYVDADLFVHTVRFMGGVGLTPLEAITCGTPVIVTRECGEVIQKANCGCIVKYGDVDDLADKMIFLLSNPEESTKMVERGRRYIEQHLSWDSIAQHIEKLYESCICHA